MNPDELEYQYSKESRSNKWFVFGAWILVLASCFIIWYKIAYYSYEAYLLLVKTEKIEFRHTPTLLK